MTLGAMEHPNRRLLYSVWAWTEEALVLARCSDHDGRESIHELFAASVAGPVEVLHRATHHPQATHRQLGTFHKPPSITELADQPAGPDGHSDLVWDLGDPGLAMTSGMNIRLRPAAADPPAPETLMSIDPGTWVADDHILYRGEASAFVERDGTRWTADRAECMALLSWGVAQFDGPQAPLERPPDPLPQRLWFRVLLPAGEGVAAAIVEDASGARIHHAAWGDRQGDLLPPGPLDLEWVPGTRRLARATLADVPSVGDRVTLTPLVTVPGALVGGLGSDWPLGAWVGDDASSRRRHPTDRLLTGLAGVEYEYLCAVEGVPEVTRAIVTLTALGPHEPSGLTGWTDPA